MRPLENTAKYHETTMQRINRERREKALKEYLDCKGTVQKDSQDTFNPIMGAIMTVTFNLILVVIMAVMLAIGMLLALPKIDSWYHEHYQKPVQEYKQEMKDKADAKAK